MIFNGYRAYLYSQEDNLRQSDLLVDFDHLIQRHQGSHPGGVVVWLDVQQDFLRDIGPATRVVVFNDVTDTDTQLDSKYNLNVCLGKAAF